VIAYQVCAPARLLIPEAIEDCLLRGLRIANYRGRVFF
jgi:hypothetical protein